MIKLTKTPSNTKIDVNDLISCIQIYQQILKKSTMAWFLTRDWIWFCIFCCIHLVGSMYPLEAYKIINVDYIGIIFLILFYGVILLPIYLVIIFLFRKVLVYKVDILHAIQIVAMHESKLDAIQVINNDLDSVHIEKYAKYIQEAQEKVTFYMQDPSIKIFDRYLSGKIMQYFRCNQYKIILAINKLSELLLLDINRQQSILENAQINAKQNINIAGPEYISQIQNFSLQEKIDQFERLKKILKK